MTTLLSHTTRRRITFVLALFLIWCILTMPAAAVVALVNITTGAELAWLNYTSFIVSALLVLYSVHVTGYRVPPQRTTA